VTQWQIPADGVAALRKRFPFIEFIHATTPEERAAAIGRIQKLATGLSLGGLKVKDLIREGRK